MCNFYTNSIASERKPNTEARPCDYGGYRRMQIFAEVSDIPMVRSILVIFILSEIDAISECELPMGRGSKRTYRVRRESATGSAGRSQLFTCL
jgi:hypothetical protein